MTEAQYEVQCGQSSGYYVGTAIIDSLDTLPQASSPMAQNTTRVEGRSLEFRSPQLKSAHGIIENCVGAIDGITIKIWKPSRREKYCSS